MSIINRSTNNSKGLNPNNDQTKNRDELRSDIASNGLRRRRATIPSQNNDLTQHQEIISSGQNAFEKCIGSTQISGNIAAFLKKTDMRNIFTANSQINETYKHLKKIPEIQKKIAAPERTWRRSLNIIAALNSNVRMNQIEPGKKYFKQIYRFPLCMEEIKYFDLKQYYDEQNEDNRTLNKLLSDEVKSFLPELFYFYFVNFLTSMVNPNSPNYLNTDNINKFNLVAYQGTASVHLGVANLIDTFTPFDTLIKIVKVNNFYINEHKDPVISNSTKLFGKLIIGYLISDLLISIFTTKEIIIYPIVPNVSLPFLLFALKLGYKEYIRSGAS